MVYSSCSRMGAMAVLMWYCKLFTGETRFVSHEHGGGKAKMCPSANDLMTLWQRNRKSAGRLGDE